jgi:MFS transporter, DHA1 family, multidrug resistance protein
MPPDELVTLSPSHRELASTDPALRFIILLGLLDAFGPLGIDMYLPAFPQIEHDLNAHGGAMQLTLSLFLAGLAIGQLICGPISDRVGRRLPLLYGSAAFALASLTCAFTRSIEALILARFVMGLAGSTGMVVARAVVRDSFEEADSSRIYSMLMLVIGIAPIISPSIGGWLMQLAGGRSPASRASAVSPSPSICRRHTHRRAAIEILSPRSSAAMARSWSTADSLAMPLRSALRSD